MRRRLPLLLLTVFAAGCGDETTPEDDVRAAVTRYGEASAAKDYQAICDELLAPDLVKNAEQYGLPCELAVKPSLEAAKSPKLTVGAVTVNGDTATAQITSTAANQKPSKDTLTLRRISDEWRIAAQR